MFTISSSRRSSSNLPIASNCPSLSPKLFYQSLLLASCFILEVTVTGTSCLAPDSLIPSTCCSLHAPVFRVFSMCACVHPEFPSPCVCRALPFFWLIVASVLILPVQIAHFCWSSCLFFLCFGNVQILCRLCVFFLGGYIYQLQQRLTSDLVFCVLYLGPLYATACTYADFKTSNLMYAVNEEELKAWDDVFLFLKIPLIMMLQVRFNVSVLIMFLYPFMANELHSGYERRQEERVSATMTISRQTNAMFSIC